MDGNTLVTLISTVGFPIAACCALFWHNWKLQENHKEELNKITEAVNNNTIALTKLANEITKGAEKNG